MGSFPWVKDVLLVISLLGVLVWVGIVIRSAYDRFLLLSVSASKELRILSDGEIVMGILGFIGTVCFFAAILTSFYPGDLTIVATRGLLVISVGCLTSIGLVWTRTHERFIAYRLNAAKQGGRRVDDPAPTTTPTPP